MAFLSAACVPEYAMRFSTLSRRAALFTGLASLVAARPFPKAAIPVDPATGRCIVPVTLDGQQVRLVLDTGAEKSVLTRTAIRRLGLPLDRWVETTLRGAGGLLETHANADVSSATLGKWKLYQYQPSGGLSFAVTDFDLGDVDGLLGADILRHYALNLDMPRGQLTLASAAEIAPSPFAVPIERLWPDLLLAPVRLDGRNLTALVDTGASASLINARGLYRLGLTPDLLARDHTALTTAIGGELTTHLHRFAELQVGAVRVSEPVLQTADVPEAAYDLTLGLDVLGRHQLLLSYAPLIMELRPG